MMILVLEEFSKFSRERGVDDSFLERQYQFFPSGIKGNVFAHFVYSWSQEETKFSRSRRGSVNA